MFQIIKGKNLFDSLDTYYVTFQNVAGLEKSNIVSINGLKVGKIEDIEPITDTLGRMRFVARISVDDEFKFSKNSHIESFEPGLIGAKQLRIIPVYDGKFAESGDTLRGGTKLSPMSQVMDQVGPVKDQITTVLSRLDSTVASANQIVDSNNRNELKALLKGMNQTVNALRITSGQANALLLNNQARVSRVLDDASQAMRDASGTVVAARTTVDRFGRVAESVDTRKLNETVEKLDKTAQGLNQLITEINAGNGSLGKLIKDEELYTNLNRTSQSLDLLVKDIKENPRRYLQISVFGK